MSETTVKQLFQRFNYRFGHRVIERRQQQWHESEEGWDFNVLLHMLYWIFRDRCSLRHSEALDVVSRKRNFKQVRERLLELAPELEAETGELNNPFISHATIEELLKQGYIRVDIEHRNNTTFAAAAQRFREEIWWTQTQPNANGEVGLMTLDTQTFNHLLDFMLRQFGWYPVVHTSESQPIYIFTPENHIEEEAIVLTTSGKYGWKGSLYSLEYLERYKDKDEICFIFATQPKEAKEQEWLLVQINTKTRNRSWSVHTGTLKQVYYIWAEQIKIPEPNFNPTTDDILDALEEWVNQ